MKKSLLFFIALALGFSVYAQQTVRSGKAFEKAKAPREVINIESNFSGNSTTITDYHPRNFKGSNAAVKKVLLGTSRNALTLLVQEQNCMYYNKDLDAILGTFRGNDKAAGTLPILGTGNQICSFLSTDGGEIFTGKIACSLTGSSFRYPSGVIFNPTGNTSPKSAYSVIAGPETTGTWEYSYMGSVQFNGNNANVQRVKTSPYAELVRQGMSACADGMVHIAGMKYSSDYFTAIGVVKNGKFNPATFSFDWTEVEVPLPFLHKASDGTVDASLGNANMAWNKSGSVGYLMFKGADTTGGKGNRGMYPILFKSVNQGATWTKMDYFDFSTFSEVNDRLFSTGTGVNDPVIPWFWETDLVVDGSDNVHVIALCKGHASAHRDSLNYYYPNEAGPIYEFSYEKSKWMCHYITTPKTHEVASAESPFIYTGANQGWSMRLQASRTDDGNKVFAVWTDTDWQFWMQSDSLNLNPDVMIWGRDINTNKYTVVKNITHNEEGWGECFFMFASPVAMDKAGVYTVPVSISDIYTSSLNSEEPIAHYYLQGVSLLEADFTLVGNSPVAKLDRLEVSSYPNPARDGKTNIVVNLDRTAPVSLVINSVTGQQVSKVSFGTIGSGSHTLPLNVSNLKSGIFFYTVLVGNQKATNKLVVK